MGDKIKTKSLSIYGNTGWFGDEIFTIEKFNELIEKTKKDYPQFTWVEFYITSTIFTGFNIIATRELTQHEKDVEKRRAEYEVLKKEFEPHAEKKPSGQTGPA